MAQFKINGAHQDTGRDMTVIVEAFDEADAREQAHELGVLIARVEVVQSEVAYFAQQISDRIAHASQPEELRHDLQSVRTIQKTSKRLKIQLLFCVVFVLIGIVAAVFSDYREEGMAIGAAGAIGYVVIRTLIWWHHG